MLPLPPSPPRPGPRLRPSRLLLPLLSLLLLAACAGSIPSAGPGLADDGLPVTPTLITTELVAEQRAQRLRQGAQDISRFIVAPTPYTIGPGDVLSITVWGHPELAVAQPSALTSLATPVEQAAAAAAAQGFVVSTQGLLQFPFAGSLKLAGLTEIEARDLLSSRIAHMIQQPHVTLRVQSYRSQRIYVDGEVRAPGLQAINDIPMHLVEALNRAGGILPTGDQSRIAIVRGGVSYQVSLPDLIRQGVDPASIQLRHGDAVRVQAADEGKVFVSGEVVTPKALLMHNGRLTLNEAIGEAGGINTVTGDARQVYVVRRAGSVSQVFRLDAASPGAMAIAEHFELTPRDTVYVAQTGLANWHRTLSMLIPGALPSAITAGRQ